MKRVSRRVGGKVQSGYLVDGEFYRTKKEAGLARAPHREYTHSDASLVQAFLVNKEFSTVQADVLVLYCAAVALTPDWDTRDIGKVQQLWYLSKFLPEYTPNAVREYCKCSGTEARRLSRALRSIQRSVTPYALSEESWLHDLVWFREINNQSVLLGTTVPTPGAVTPLAGFLGDKSARTALAFELIAGEFGGIDLTKYPSDWGTGLSAGESGESYRGYCVEIGSFNTETGELIL